jgi:hypothetical protein
MRSRRRVCGGVRQRQRDVDDDVDLGIAEWLDGTFGHGVGFGFR